MKRTLLLTSIFGLALFGLAGGPASAGDRSMRSAERFSEHPRSAYYRRHGRRPQVRGYTARRGGYSYSYADSIDTYGSSRTVFGGSSFYRDPMLDRQTNAGPFDHGFFFDSGMGPHGGESPYLH